MLTDQWDMLSADDKLMEHTSFFKNCKQFILRLNGLIDENLFTCKASARAELLKKAMFQDLTNFWSEIPQARLLHKIHPTWSGGRLHSSMYRRYTHTVYHNLALGRGPIRAVIHRNSFDAECRQCRHGCREEETVEHVILRCQHVDCIRRKIEADIGIRPLTIEIALSRIDLTNSVEHLIAAFLTQQSR